MQNCDDNYVTGVRTEKKAERRVRVTQVDEIILELRTIDGTNHDGNVSLCGGAIIWTTKTTTYYLRGYSIPQGENKWDALRAG